jgi:SAM-dependent methyltransferase
MKKTTTPKTITGNWYDYPKYYDIAFSDDTAQEVAFIEAACKKYCPFPVQSLLEPACGSGRLVVELAGRGYAMTGIDVGGPALDFLRKRLARKKLSAHLIQGDMGDFTLPKPMDAAYCLLNSFRHLMTEEAATAHLKCMAQALRPGGIYILGLHLVPPDAYDSAIERWKVTQGKTVVGVDLRVVACNRRQRSETIRVSLRAKTGDKQWHLRGEFDLRLYTAAQLRKLLAGVPEFELCDIFDFWYDISDPLKLSNELSDIVLILRRHAL